MTKWGFTLAVFLSSTAYSWTKGVPHGTWQSWGQTFLLVLALAFAHESGIAKGNKGAKPFWVREVPPV